MQTVLVQTRVDANLKKQAEEVLSSIGMDMTSAIRMFLTQVVNYKGIPFMLRTKDEPSSYMAAEPAATYGVSPSSPSINRVMIMVDTMRELGLLDEESVRRQAIESFQEIRRQAESRKGPEMTLDEINEFIAEVRKERKRKTSE